MSIFADTFPLDSLQNIHIAHIELHDIVSVTFHFDWDLKQVVDLVKESDRILVEKLNKRIKQCSSPVEFVNESALIYAKYHKLNIHNNTDDTNGGTQVDLIMRIYHELKIIGWNHVKSVNHDPLKITLLLKNQTTVDTDMDEYEVTLNIPFDYPSRSPTISSSSLTPLNTCFSNPSNTSSSLMDIYNYYRNMVAKVSAVKSILRELDTHLKTSACSNPYSRRLYIDDDSRISVQVDIDPDSHETCPTVQLFGPDIDILRIRSHFMANRSKWNTFYGGSSYIDKLEMLLCHSLLRSRPKSATEKVKEVDMAKEDDDETCAICYGELKPCVPLDICDSCRKQYHKECIRDWCTSCPSSRVSFDRLFGTCPYCDSTILIKL